MTRGLSYDTREEAEQVARDLKRAGHDVKIRRTYREGRGKFLVQILDPREAGYRALKKLPPPEPTGRLHEEVAHTPEIEDALVRAEPHRRVPPPSAEKPKTVFKPSRELAVKLPEEAQHLLEEELAAREMERIRRGEAPEHLIGDIRWIGKIPMKVPRDVKEDIGKKELARYVSAQERLPKLQEKLSELQTDREELEDRGAKLAEKRAELYKKVEEMRAKGEDDPALTAAYNETKREIAKAQEDMAKTWRAKKRTELAIDDTQWKIATKGAYKPKHRTAIVAMGRIAGAIEAGGRYAHRDIQEGLRRSGGRAGGVVAGMKRAIPRAPAGARTAFGRGSELPPAISEFGRARIAQEPRQIRIAQEPSQPRIAMAPGEPRIAEGIGVSPEVRFRLNGKLDLRRRRKEEEEELRE